MGWPKGWSSLESIDKGEFHEWLKGFGAKDLSTLRSGVREAQDQWSPGGCGCIQSPKVLQSDLCEQPQAPQTLGDTPLSSEEAQEVFLRSVRADGISTCPSCRRQSREQQAGEYSDTVCLLPQFSSRYGRSAWLDGSWENAIPRIATGIVHRVDRLKALGNGQVPAVVAAAWHVLHGQLAI